MKRCVRCGYLTYHNEDIPICDKCREREKRTEELIKKYGDIEKPLSVDHITSIFRKIITEHMVSTFFIFDMFDKMDKMWEVKSEPRQRT